MGRKSSAELEIVPYVKGWCFNLIIVLRSGHLAASDSCDAIGKLISNRLWEPGRCLVVR